MNEEILTYLEENLRQFIEENIEFAYQGTRPNQDIYYNKETNGLWVHTYFGNESLSPDTEEDNLFIIGIKNTIDFTGDCSFCDGDCDGNDGTDCKEWQECHAEDLFFNLVTHQLDILPFGGLLK